MGLLHLREFESFFVFATRGVQCVLQKENRIFRVLERSNPPVKWQALPSKGRLGCHLSDDSSGPSDFICGTVPLGGGYPDYVSEEIRSTIPPEDASIGLVMEQGDRRFFFAPSVSGASGMWKAAAESANPILDEGSAEHRVVLDAGFEIAYDGMELEL
jgi:hypothetical protein